MRARGLKRMLHKRNAAIGLIVIVVALLAISGYRQYVWRGSHVAGEIKEISAHSLLLTDRRAQERVVELSDAVEVRKGDEIYRDELKVGDHVLIIGEPTDAGFKAQIVRLIGPPRSK